MAVDFCKITCVVLTYWVISITMLFTNKYLVGDRKDEVDVSLFVAWFQCCVTVAFVFLVKLIKKLWNFRRTNWGEIFSIVTIKQFAVNSSRIFMLTCSYVSMLSFNNLCLKHVGVAFFQIARSLTLVFTVILSVVLLKKSVSWRVLLSCGIVAGGFVLGVDQEGLVGNLSTRGVLYGVTTSMFVALNGIFTKRCLPLVDHNSTQLTLYNNINASIVLFPIVLFTGQIQGVMHSSHMTNPLFWGFLLATGVLGFAIAWISAIQIDVTSPITHHISANSKSIVQTLIAVIYYHTVRPVAWWCSVVLVALGATVYAVVRIHEDRWENEKALKTKLDVESPEAESKVSIRTTCTIKPLI